MKRLAAAVMIFCAVGCTPSPPPTPAADPAMTAEQKSVYELCLERNMAVATAWELIEQQCRAQALDKPDPLLKAPTP